MTDPVVKTVEAPCGAAEAFDVFTRRIAEWWPLGRNTVSAMTGGVARSVAIEGRVGGAVVETGPDGETHRWGTVRRWAPGEALTIAWAIGRPESEATVVDVTFEPLGPGRTRVTLVHHGWEALGDDAESQREGYAKGWVGVFEEAYAAACARP